MQKIGIKIMIHIINIRFQMKQARVFSSFLKQILKTKKQQKLYYSDSKTIQSSVGIIFRCKSQPKYNSIDSLIQNWKSIKNIEMLMTQRAGYEKDSNAYNIVFPGGQADLGESDLQACKRELNQQVNINTDEDCMYVGQIPRNFYYSKKKNKYVYISCHVWVLKPDSSYTPKLNQQQLSDFRWVPVIDIINLNNLTVYNQKQLNFFNRMGFKFLHNSVKHNLKGVSFPGFNVGMKRDLWGLTLWIVGYILQMAQQNIKKSPFINEDEEIINNVESIMLSLRELDIRFDRKYILGYPMIWMAKTWHYFYRIKPFSYAPSKWKLNLNPLFVFALILSLMALIVNLI